MPVTLHKKDEQRQEGQNTMAALQMADNALNTSTPTPSGRAFSMRRAKTIVNIALSALTRCLDRHPGRCDEESTKTNGVSSACDPQILRLASL